MDQIKDGVSFLACRIVSCRRIDAYRSVETYGAGSVICVCHLSMRHVLQVLPVRLRTLDVRQAGLVSFIREDVHVCRVCYLCPVHYERVWVDVWNDIGESD